MYAVTFNENKAGLRFNNRFGPPRLFKSKEPSLHYKFFYLFIMMSESFT